jgi:hypothetical protein
VGRPCRGHPPSDGVPEGGGGQGRWVSDLLIILIVNMLMPLQQIALHI